MERYDATAIAAVCTQSFRDALQHMARYKQLTCPEELRVHTNRDEATVEFVFLQAEELEPEVLVDVCLVEDTRRELAHAAPWGRGRSVGQLSLKR